MLKPTTIGVLPAMTREIYRERARILTRLFASNLTMLMLTKIAVLFAHSREI
jgi:hypothetical protein